MIKSEFSVKDVCEKKRSSLAELRLEIVEKASQSLPIKRKKIEIIFCQGVYLTENTYQAASV